MLAFICHWYCSILRITSLDMIKLPLRGHVEISTPYSYSFTLFPVSLHFNVCDGYTPNRQLDCSCKNHSMTEELSGWGEFEQISRSFLHIFSTMLLYLLLANRTKTNLQMTVKWLLKDPKSMVWESGFTTPH